MRNVKVALVYDWMDSNGGAERLLPVFQKMFSHAHWYTSVAHKQHESEYRLHSSFIQNLPFISASRKASLPFYPFAFESFNLTDYELVISITSSFAKGVITKPGTPHVCYMLTPTRFLWSGENDYVHPLAQIVAKPYISYLKRWDVQAAMRPDHIVAISNTVSARIKEYYQRPSQVLYPPMNVQYWENCIRNAHRPQAALPESYYLCVSRLVPYKKVDLAVKAFAKLRDKSLVIVGKGSEKQRLQRMASKNVTFLEDLTDYELAYLYSHAKALIMPQEEDFGYTALEAQMCSSPVIAYNKGGATETVVHNKTGVLFDRQTVADLCDAIAHFEKVSYTIDNYVQVHGSKLMEPYEEDTFITSFTTLIQKTL